MSTNWRVYGKDTVAYRLDRCNLPGLFRKKIVVGPGEAAIVLRDGQVQTIMTEASAEVASVLDQVCSLFKLGADIAVYFVDISPLDISIFIGQTAKGTTTAEGTTHATATSRLEVSGSQSSSSAAQQFGWIEESDAATTVSSHSGQRLDVSQLNILALSADKEVIQAECRLRVHIDPEDPARFVTLLKGKRAIATWDIAALLRDEVFARVLVPEIAQRQSTELREDSTILHVIEQAVRQRLDSTFRAFGLILDSFTIL